MRQLELHEVSLPLRRPFQTSAGTVAERNVVIVGIADDGHTGWGEAAPYPGITDESVSMVWDGLVKGAAGILEGRDVDLPPTGAAAVDEATIDLEARRAGQPLWELLGGVNRPLIGTLAIAALGDEGLLIELLERAVADGFKAVKVKIGPDWDRTPIELTKRRYPELAVAADANGAYELGDPLFDSLDDLSLAYIEQPLAATRIHEHAVLRQRMETPVCLDESLTSTLTAAQIMEVGAAEILCLKPARLGVRGAMRIAADARSQGMRLKVSGLLESSIGKGHSLAVATTPGVEHVDLAPTASSMSTDVTTSGWEMNGGTVSPRATPGIGLEPDPTRLDTVSVRSISLTR